MSSPPGDKDKPAAPTTNGSSSKEASQAPPSPSASAPAAASSALPSFQSDVNEGTLNPKLLGLQPNPGPLPRGHVPRQTSHSTFKMPISSQPSLPALSTATATSIDSQQNGGASHSNGSTLQQQGAAAAPPPPPPPPPQSQPLANNNSQQQQQPPPQPQQPSQQQQQQSNVPAMHLFPLNDTFIPKAIHLPPQVRVKIGRQTNTKSVPASNNGYFDSKVLSRTHAEVWFDTDSPAGAGVFIKDVGSSNGTFINGDRLSAEGMKSDVFQLREGDQVEFGIDIASEDNKTILHHKVSAKVALAVTPEDAERIAKSPAASNSFAAVRRMSRAPGMSSSGISFDHILQRLQSELQRSRDAGQDLQAASMTLHKAHEAIHGNLPPPSMPSYPHTLPPVAPAQQNFTAVQSQLTETQASLTVHSDRVKSLEETITSLKDEVERTKSEMEVLLSTKTHPLSALEHATREHDAEDDDARSEADSLASVETAHVDAATQQQQRDLQDEAESRHRTANAALLTRIEQLSTELSQANSISAELASQHQNQSTALEAIQARLAKLEDAPQQEQRQAPSSPIAPVQQDDSNALEVMEQRWNAWKSTFEASWQQERASWHEERSRLESKIAELEAASSQQSPRRKRKTRRRRDGDGSSSTSGGGSDEEHSMARASTPSSVASGLVTLSESEAGPSSPRKAGAAGGLKQPELLTTDDDETARDRKLANGSAGPAAWKHSNKAKPDNHMTTTKTVTLGAMGCVTVAVIAFFAAAVTGQAPKD